MAIWGALILGVIVLWFGSTLPELEDLTQLPRQASVTLRDARGNILASYGDLYGRPVRAEDLPPHVIQALLVTEDRRFYHHWGVDPIGLVRAFTRNVKAGHVVQGGSTITQQLAKNFLQSKKIFTLRDRSLKRKISEAILAFQIERRFTKNQILTMYLNRVCMREGTWGLDAASIRYFGRHATELGLYESAILVGLLKGISRYSPVAHQERSEERAKKILQLMVEAKMISQDAAVAAMAMPAPLEKGLRRQSARYFTDWVMEQLAELVDIHSEDLEVMTTLNIPLQHIAERQAKRIMETRGAEYKASQVALVSMAPDGAVQAMLGGTEYRSSPFNRATQAHRQPGSTFKYFCYLAALEEGYTPHSLIGDTPVSIGGWTPKNFDSAIYKYHPVGQVSLLTAFAKSLNTSAARLVLDVGDSKLRAMARRLGITSPMPKNYTVVLGTGGVTLVELTGAFAVMANQGYKATPYGIRWVKNRQGKLLYERKPSQTPPIINKKVLQGMNELLTEVIKSGTGRAAAIPNVWIRGKSGTSQRHRDAWFIAMTPDLVTGVWSGCDNEKPMNYVPGGSPSLHLWKAFHTSVLHYKKNPSLPEWEDEDSPLPQEVTQEETPKAPPQTTLKPEREDEEDLEDEEAEGEGDDAEEDEEEDEPVKSPKETPSIAPRSTYHNEEERKNLMQEIWENMMQ